jgi:hypothetical protein
MARGTTSGSLDSAHNIPKRAEFFQALRSG